MKRGLKILAFSLITSFSAVANEPPPKSGEHPFDPEEFLAAYCWECHDELVQKGDRRLDDLALDPGTDIFMAERWEEVMHQLQLGEMPPSDEAQPTDEERRSMIHWVRKTGDQVRERTNVKSERVTHRRLNRLEYLYTVRDLFGITEGDFDPTGDFPADQAVEGFLNNGHALQTSPQLMEQYFRAADEVIDYAYGLVEASSGEKPQTWTLDGTNPKDVLGSVATGIMISTAEDGSKHTSLAHGLSSHSGTYDGKLFLRGFLGKGARESGWYEFTVEVRAANRFHEYGDALMWSVVDSYYENDDDFFNPNEPMQIGIGTQFGGSPQERTRTRPNLRVVENLPDNQWVKRQYRVWLDEGSRPYLAFVNGPPKGVKFQFVTNRIWEFDKRVPRIKPTVRSNLSLRAKRNAPYYDFYRGPELHVRRVDVTGPFHDEKPRAKDLLFRKIDPATKAPIDHRLLRRELRHIATALFRSPQNSSDLERFAIHIEAKLDEGARYDEALRPVLKAFLCSPSFLYLTETGSGESDRLLRRELANRLTYFLHGSLPDSSTIQQVSTSESIDSDLMTLVDRLLDDEKSERFVRLFADQWLGLSDLGSMPPGNAEFPAYYIHELETVAKEETYRVLEELFRENRPVTDLVNADFTYVNRGLALLYGFDPPPAGTWERVSLPPDSPRRGLPGQASILTVTSNGVETSPVTRGVWMLEKLFGTPPAPAPPDVPALEPDIRGAKTVRELLEKHREVKACADCHDRIDPLGYVFESFDPIGRFRETYKNGTAIDTTGHYRGTPVKTVQDVRAFLLDHPDLLTHNLAEKMLTFALGRELGFQDGDDLDRLIRQWKQDGLGMRDLLKRVVTSEPFLSL